MEQVERVEDLDLRVFFAQNLMQQMVRLAGDMQVIIMGDRRYQPGAT